MSYKVILEERAQDDLRKPGLPKPVALFIGMQLLALGDNPTALSRKSHIPYRESCQIYEFNYDFEGQRYIVHVLFQYGQDEESLHVQDIAIDAPEHWEEWPTY